MAQRCGFFDAKFVGDDYDRVYVAEQFAKYFASFIGNGVYNNQGSEILTVKENDPKSMSVVVTPGQGWINGYWYENTASVELNIDVADGIRNRKDSVVLRWDKEQRDMYLMVIKGELSVSPVAPAPVRNAEYYDLLLGIIDVKAGTINIANRQIVDTRMDTSVCGYVTGVVRQVDTSTLYQQFNDFYNNFITVEAERFVNWANTQQEEFEAWFEGIKQILDEKVVTNLLNLIEGLRLSIARPFDAATNYVQDMYCYYTDNKLYKCTVDNHYGPWDGSHFEEVKLAEDVYNLALRVATHDIDISALNESVTEHSASIAAQAVQISNINSTVSGHTSTLSVLDTKINDITPIGIGHTSILRGKYLGSSFTSKQQDAISSKTFDDLFIGDYWLSGAGYYVILDIFLIGSSGVLIIGNFNSSVQRIHSGSISGIGYKGCDIRKRLQSTNYNSANSFFNGKIMKRALYLTKDAVTSQSEPLIDKFEYVKDCYVDLFSSYNIYGSSRLYPYSKKANELINSQEAGIQFKYFKFTNGRIVNPEIKGQLFNPDFFIRCILGSNVCELINNSDENNILSPWSSSLDSGLNHCFDYVTNYRNCPFYFAIRCN